MNLNVDYVDNEKLLKAWNIDEPVIAFYNDQQHSVVPLSRVSGLQIKNMLKKWPLPNSQLIVDKILELVNTPNVTDEYVVQGLVAYLNLKISDEFPYKWERSRDNQEVRK